jgi:hypothetical protein
MSEHPQLPEVPARALRDVGTSERLDRVWNRLEQTLAGKAPHLRGSFEWVWAPAAVVIIFLSGFFAGLSWDRTEAPRADITREPVPPIDKSGAEPGRPNHSPDRATRPAEQPNKKLRNPPRPPVRPMTEESPVTGSMPAVVKDPAPPDWQQIWLEDEEAERAAVAIAQRGGFEQVLRQASPEQLMILVSIAQAVGEPQHAMAALRRVVESYPRDPAAPQAAFMLGKELEKAGDRAGAERAFATCRALSPQSEIAEDALARQIEAALEQGERAGARQLVEQYEREFPQGSRLAEFRAALAKKSEESPSAAAPSVTTAEPEIGPVERGPAPAVSAGR